ncbi:MAG TPA: hypothetical protein VGO47_04990 [Chlamydiales bacterium]|nr:hypothetical protein [Chlamydiales bacterium]
MNTKLSEGDAKHIERHLINLLRQPLGIEMSQRQVESHGKNVSKREQHREMRQRSLDWASRTTTGGRQTKILQ